MTCSRVARLALLTLVVACEDPYLSNPDLQCLLKTEGHYLFSPVLSPDGRKLYYLDDSTYDRRDDPKTVMRGDICVCDLADSTDRILLQGTFCALALSANGEVLAALSKPDGMDFVGDSTLYVVLDTAATSADSIYFHHRGSEWGPWGVHLSVGGDKLFLDGWSDSTYVYEMDLPGDWVSRRVASYPWPTRGIDLLGGDSVYAESAAGPCRASANPRDPRRVIFSKKSGAFSYDWMLRDRASDTLGWLGAKTKPYTAGYIDWPTWTADGRDLVFSAMAVGDDAGTRMEIWMLENALKDTAEGP